MTQKTTLKDIAQAVGVSITLVSYVLNNKHENRIGKAVAEKIRRVAKELNYTPNQLAKSLKANRTRTLGLIVADIANPFFSSLARIIEQEADGQGYSLIFGSSEENPEKCRRLVTTLLSRQVDGLIFAAPEGIEPQIRQLQQQRVPLVLLDRYFPALRTNYVALDNHQALYLAVEHLIGLGYRRIALVTLESELFHLQERTRGYRDALSDHSIAFDQRRLKAVRRQELPTGVAAAVEEFTAGSQPVEAIVFASNTLALHGLKHLKSMSVRVPEQVALVSFDEADFNDLFDSPLTYIRQPLLEMGRLATRILVDTLQSAPELRRINLEATLVVQRSTHTLSKGL